MTTTRLGFRAPFLWGTLVGLLVAPLVSVLAAEGLPPGSGSFQFVDERGNADKPITVWTHAPQKLKSTSPVVFVMHGVRRNGQQYRDQWVDHADKHGFLLVVPEFAEPHYPSSAYQRGNVVDDNGRPIDKSKWTFSAIEHLFDHVKKLSGNTSDRYCLYGHSAGGQFVHRMVLLLPEARWRRAIAANPGYYTMPDFEIGYPYGLRGTTATPETLGQVLARDFVLMLGDQDTKRDDPNLQKTPQADAQGLNRLERGKTFFNRAKQQADRKSVV